MKYFSAQMRLCSKITVFGFLCALVAFTGCNGNGGSSEAIGQSNASATTFPTAAVAPEQTVSKPKGSPQPKLPVLKLWVGTNEVATEIASTHYQISTGMMFRTNMAEMEGMLFVFPQPQQVSFYMRNTLLPLSCAYIDPEGTILEIYDMQPLSETPIPSQSSQIQYVLEVNQGWFERHHVKAGVAISTERGTLAQTFRRR